MTPESEASSPAGGDEAFDEFADHDDEYVWEGRSKNTKELIGWLWTAATFGSALMSLLGTVITVVLAIVLYRRGEKRQAIAGTLVSLIVVLTIAYLYLSNAY